MIYCYLLVFIAMAFSSSLSIASINTNGLRDNTKCDTFLNYFIRRKFQIVLLQETHTETSDEYAWAKKWEGEIIFSHGNRASKGVAILISNKAGVKCSNVSKDEEGRWVKVDISWGENKFTIMSVYAPNQICERVTFFKCIDNMLTENDPIIMGGDFNCHLDNITAKDSSRTNIINILKRHGLKDVWRTIHSNNPGYTFYRKGLSKPSRLDYFFISSDLLNVIEQINTNPTGLSDHEIIHIKLINHDNPKGPGRWICNNSILNNEDCSFRINHFWDYWKKKKNNYPDLLTWWEYGKTKLKEIIRNLCIEKSNSEKKETVQLHKQYEELLNNPNPNSDHICEVEHKLKDIEIKKWEKAKIRVRNIKKNDDEKPSKYYLGLEKQQITTHKIDKLQIRQDIYVNETEAILDCVNCFYTDLYKYEDISIHHMNGIMSQIEDKQIPQDNLNDLEKDLTIEELTFALKQMKKNKSPGIDGLTVEFYLTYWDILKYDLWQVLNDCIKRKVFPNTMNTALVRLIYKNKGDRTDLKNWRPISLLTVDYKIFSKVITNRMKTIMPSIIGEEQTSGVSNRNIQNNLMILRDTVDYINWNNCDGALISIDQEKAFDRINWNYLFNIMIKMGIPDKIIQWIELLYNNPRSCIIVNNFIGSPISIKRGIRQGCPLSPLLYSICAEGLASLIRNNKDFNGFNPPDIPGSIKLVQHADDTTIFISKDKEFNVVNNIINIYSKGSGSKINVTKSKGLWLGKWKSRQDKPCQFSWTNEKLKILGIYFGNDVTLEDNWGPIVNKMYYTLERWSKRKLTLYGKAVIVNTMVGAGLNYFGSILPCSEYWFKKMNDVIWNFYWNGKPDKIKRNIITSPKEFGGTGLVDIKCKMKCLKLKWLANFCKLSGKWKNLFNYWICRTSRDEKLEWYIFNNNYRDSQQTTDFYRNLITAFREAGGKITPSYSCVHETNNIPLWSNAIVTVNNNPMNSPVLKTAGITVLKDIIVQGEIINYRDLASRYNLRHNITGPLSAKLKRCINMDLVKETRSGPMNHIANWLSIWDPSQEIDIPICNTSVKNIYDKGIVSKFVIPPAQEKWQNILCRTQIDWKTVWTNLYCNKLIDSYERDLWFKIKHRILPTKSILYKINITADNICPLCDNEPETVEHLFIYCIKNQGAWIYVESLLKKYSGNKQFYLNDCARILGEKLNSVHTLLVGKMIKEIWLFRCKIIFDKVSNKDYKVIMKYKNNLKQFLTFERHRLTKETFTNLYAKNNAMCTLRMGKIAFNF